MHCVVDADIHARTAATAESVDFSAVSWTQATQLVQELQFIEVEGFEEAPMETPEGQDHHSKTMSLL